MAQVARFPRWNTGWRFWRWAGGGFVDSWEFKLADAIAAELNDPSRGWAGFFSVDSVTAVVTEAPWYKPEQLSTLKVAVVPLTLGRDRAARGVRLFDYGIGVDLQKIVKATDTPSQRVLSRIAEQMHDWFDNAHILDVSPGNWRCLKAERADVYSLNQLYGKDIWGTFLSLSIRGYRP